MRREKEAVGAEDGLASQQWSQSSWNPIGEDILVPNQQDDDVIADQVPESYESDDDEDTIRQQVIARIEELALSFVQDLETSLPKLSMGRTEKSLDDIRQSRGYTSILLVLHYCHSLLQSHRTTTTREVYYFYVTHFRNQRECDQAIWEVCQLLQVPRHALGLHASSKGWLWGPNVRILSSRRRVVWDSRGDDQPQAFPITAEWLGSNLTIEAPEVQCILVVEKEGIFQHLMNDGLANCIVVTGKGFPDVATRAAVYRLHHQLQVPVFGLADCDPFGVSVLQCYAGSSRRATAENWFDDGRGDQYGVPIQWLGLRPSQVEHLSSGDTSLPPEVFLKLTDLDRKRIQTLLAGEQSFCADGRRREELESMCEFKVELEAMHWLGMDFCSSFVEALLAEYELDSDETPDWMQII